MVGDVGETKPDRDQPADGKGQKGAGPCRKRGRDKRRHDRQEDERRYQWVILKPVSGDFSRRAGVIPDRRDRENPDEDSRVARAASAWIIWTGSGNATLTVKVCVRVDGEVSVTEKRCAFLTMDNTDGWAIDSDLSFEPMQALGWAIDMVPWQSANVDWEQYQAVYICTPWDYPANPASFIALLESIDASSAILVNDIALVHWTIPKTYLRDLETRGAAIVPSLWYDEFDVDTLPGLFETHRTSRIIVKPVVSTNAHDTFLLDKPVPDKVVAELKDVFATRPFVVQPFIESVLAEGEYSLFFFSNEFSHAILKTPKDEDFRVQEEHGARIISAEPEIELLETASALLRLVEPMPVYARCDFLRGPDGRFLLMELEVIEPSLYLRMNSDAPMRFARAFDSYVARSRASS